jgi:hypothetical protein
LDIAAESRKIVLVSLQTCISIAGFLAVGTLVLVEGPARGQPPPGRKTVYAWFPTRFGSWKTDGLQWDCLTHLCFRSVELKADGTLRAPVGDPPPDFVETAHRHHARVTVLVWVARAEDSDGYLADHPQEAAENLLAYVQRNRLDGVNIDDEQMREFNPTAGKPNRDLVNRFFQSLSRTFRRANPEYHLSFAAPAVISAADRLAVKWLDLGAISTAVDAIIPMGYTLNPPSIGWSTNPEPLGGGGRAPATTTRDLKTMARDYLQSMGGDRRKLLIGLSVNPGGNEFRCRTELRLSPTTVKGVWKTLAECEEQARRHGRRWDAAQQSPWYCYREGELFVQGWYNDAASWKARLDWVKEEGFGGIGLWILDGVIDPPERWQALRGFAGAGRQDRVHRRVTESPERCRPGRAEWSSRARRSETSVSQPRSWCRAPGS